MSATEVNRQDALQTALEPGIRLGKGPASQNRQVLPGFEPKRSNPLQVVFHYWETRPEFNAEGKWIDPKGQLTARLDQLLRQGIQEVAVFVPWQIMEADITHSFARFLQGLIERRMRVELVVTPELGLPLPYSGMPKELLQKPGVSAEYSPGKSISSVFPPGVFAVPSLFSPEFNKRYSAFLSRVDGILSTIEKSNPSLGSNSSPGRSRIQVSLSGSFWKYYNSENATPENPYAEMGGDRAPQTELAFRKHLDQFFSQREFSDWRDPGGTDGIKRQWFYQLSEEVFRIRSAQQLSKKTKYSRSGGVDLVDLEIYTPEADPVFRYSNTLAALSPVSDHFELLSGYITQAVTRKSTVRGQIARPVFHWTSLGSFRSLTESQRQFLLLKTLFLSAARGGSVFIDEQEWASFSSGFRARAMELAHAFCEMRLTQDSKSLYQVPHLWSGGDVLEREIKGVLSSGLAAELEVVASADACLALDGVSLMMVDPGCLITVDHLRKWLAWLWSEDTTEEKVLVLPRSPFFTKAAREHLESFLKGKKPLDVNLGLPYQVFAEIKGEQSEIFRCHRWLVLYDARYGSLQKLEASKVKQFAESMVSLARIKPIPVILSEARIETKVLDIKGGGSALLLFNPHTRPLKTTVTLGEPASVSDLTVALRRKNAQPSQASMPVSEFEIEVPAFGILSIALEGGTWSEHSLNREELLAAQGLAESLQKTVDSVAANELPGESIWN